MRGTISNFLKQYAFMLALAAMFTGFSAFKAAEGKRQTNYYQLVDDEEYRMVDITTGTCQPPSPTICLWEIESEELSIPKDLAENAQPYGGHGVFTGSFVTE